MSFILFKLHNGNKNNHLVIKNRSNNKINKEKQGIIKKMNENN